VLAAFILINVEPGAEEDIVKKLRKIPEAKGIFRVYGVYDIIVRVETGTTNDIKNIVRRKIRILENVRSTMTMIVTDSIDRTL
jgi:DNA-binding Lrp family transcriptional regulator